MWCIVRVWGPKGRSKGKFRIVMSRDKHFSGKEIFFLVFFFLWGVGGGVTLFLSLTFFRIFEIFIFSV